MPGGQHGAGRRKPAGVDDPVPHHVPAERGVAQEADADAGDDEPREEPRQGFHPAGGRRHTGQAGERRGRIQVARLQAARDARQVRRADHDENAPMAGRDELFDARAHVGVAFGDQRLVDRRGALRELGKGGLKQVVLLEALHTVLIDILRCEHARDQPREQIGALPPGHVPVDPLQRDADIAVDQREFEALRLGTLDGGAHLGARFGAQLLGEAILEGAEREHRGDHRRLAVADHLEEVELREGGGVGECAMPAAAEFHRDTVVVALGDLAGDGLRAGLRHVGRAQQADKAVAQREVAARLLTDIGHGAQSRKMTRAQYTGTAGGASRIQDALSAPRVA